LIGIEWLNYLDKQGGSQLFSHGIGKQLLYLPYQKTDIQSSNDNISAFKLIALVKHWVIKNT